MDRLLAGGRIWCHSRDPRRAKKQNARPDYAVRELKLLPGSLHFITMGSELNPHYSHPVRDPSGNDIVIDLAPIMAPAKHIPRAPGPGFSPEEGDRVIRSIFAPVSRQTRSRDKSNSHLSNALNLTFYPPPPPRAENFSCSAGPAFPGRMQSREKWKTKTGTSTPLSQPYSIDFCCSFSHFPFPH